MSDTSQKVFSHRLTEPNCPSSTLASMITVKAVGSPGGWRRRHITMQTCWQLGPAAIDSHKCRSCLCRISVSWRHQNPDLTLLPRDWPVSLWQCQVFVSAFTPFPHICHSFSGNVSRKNAKLQTGLRSHRWRIQLHTLLSKRQRNTGLYPTTLPLMLCWINFMIALESFCSLNDEFKNNFLNIFQYHTNPSPLLKPKDKPIRRSVHPSSLIHSHLADTLQIDSSWNIYYFFWLSEEGAYVKSSKKDQFQQEAAL